MPLRLWSSTCRKGKVRHDSASLYCQQTTVLLFAHWGGGSMSKTMELAQCSLPHIPPKQLTCFTFGQPALGRHVKASWLSASLTAPPVSMIMPWKLTPGDDTLQCRCHTARCPNDNTKKEGQSIAAVTELLACRPWRSPACTLLDITFTCR